MCERARERCLDLEVYHNLHIVVHEIKDSLRLTACGTEFGISGPGRAICVHDLSCEDLTVCSISRRKFKRVDGGFVVAHKLRDGSNESSIVSIGHIVIAATDIECVWPEESGGASVGSHLDKEDICLMQVLVGRCDNFVASDGLDGVQIGRSIYARSRCGELVT